MEERVFVNYADSGVEQLLLHQRQRRLLCLRSTIVEVDRFS